MRKWIGGRPSIRLGVLGLLGLAGISCAGAAPGTNSDDLAPFQLDGLVFEAPRGEGFEHRQRDPRRDPRLVFDRMETSAAGRPTSVAASVHLLAGGRRFETADGFQRYVEERMDGQGKTTVLQSSETEPFHLHGEACVYNRRVDESTNPRAEVGSPAHLVAYRLLCRHPDDTTVLYDLAFSQYGNIADIHPDLEQWAQDFFQGIGFVALDPERQAQRLACANRIRAEGASSAWPLCVSQAEAGNAEAREIVDALRLKRGMQPGESDAVRALRQAALAGDIHAAWKLGADYAAAADGSADEQREALVFAWAWFGVAFALGHEEAFGMQQALATELTGEEHGRAVTLSVQLAAWTPVARAAKAEFERRFAREKRKLSSQTPPGSRSK